MANIHRFTPSCSRCRQKKLKCDTNLPCNQCIAKGVHDECRKDSRVPRGRKRPKLVATSSSEKSEDEVALLRKRVKELEQMVVRQSAAGSPSQPPLSPCSTSLRRSDKRTLSSHQLGTSSRGSQTTGPSEFSHSHSRDRYSPTVHSFDSDEEEPGETEASLVTLEKLAASDPRVSEPGHGKAMNKQINNVLPSSSTIPRKASNAYFAAPAAFNERIELLMHAKRIIPDKHIVDTLLHTFNLRCHNLVGRIMHMPSVQKDVDFFAQATVEELLTSPLDMYDLARYLMILRLGMRFYPWKGGMFTDDTTPEFIAINALKNRGDDISLQWLNLAKRGLAVERSFSLGSLTAIQTAILMILDGRDSPAYLRMLLRISIQTSLDMGLHRLGSAMPSSKKPDDHIVYIESGVRIWWYLVVKDWCSAQREGAYTIHPSQMTTRKPLHTTDARLAEGRTDEISRDDYCETSYTLCQIELANIIRESIDLRNEQSTLGGVYDVISPNNQKLLHVKLETFLGDLPPFYRLDSTEMRPGVLAVQRCLLHQQTFDVLLKLNRKSLSSYSERATCTLLAEQIVSTQKLLRSVCPVIDGFWVNFLHLFGATLTLTISLLLDEDLTAETRSRRRGKVQSALDTMRETPGSDRGSRIIETLLEEEQQQLTANQHLPASEVAARRRSVDIAALTRRIVAHTAELADAPARSGGAAGLTPAPIEGSSSSGGGARDGSAGSGRTWDLTPDESVVPAFASSWGLVATDSMDPTDPMGLLSSYAPPSRPGNGLFPNEQYACQAQIEHVHHTVRPYEHSLRPWQEPSPALARSTGAVDATVSNADENNLWDWVFRQAALLHGPEPPIEGPPRSASVPTPPPRTPITPVSSGSNASRGASSTQVQQSEKSRSQSVNARSPSLMSSSLPSHAYPDRSDPAAVRGKSSSSYYHAPLPPHPSFPPRHWSDYHSR
ncbi:hypothetical protein EX895_003763 [Sporisorium graminicola]|uniref:Zn(2)-C6 fungal-type domain-containing protein n=1 Tax=Sporisorium graminicola TaxID=280036 RepID=A0A4U7KSN7_9BASI|nr:hypothetical protein EX895_003763 [Sporisorium graminicola]TKY87086.1 hypothetical protein EX895_003763 [Sporisorium graminicola]